MERYCGGLELYSVYRSELNMSTNLFVSAEYSKTLDKASLYPALAKVMEKNVMLNVNIWDVTNKKPLMKKLEYVNLNDVVEYRPEIETAEELADEQFKGSNRFVYEQEKPLWKLAILGKSQKLAAFLFDHGPLDGTAGALFHEKLLNELNANLTGTPTTVVNNQELLPSVESHGQTKPSIGFAAKFIAANVLKSIIGSKKVYKGPSPMTPPESKTLFVELDPHRTSSLIAAARVKKLTVNSLLYGSVIQSVACYCKENNVDEDSTLSFSTPVNARRYTGNPKDLVCYVYQHEHDLKGWNADASPGRFVDEWVAKFSADLKKTLSKEKPQEIAWVIGLLSYAPVKEYLKDELKKERGHSAEMSNLGAFDLDDKTKDWSITKLALAQPVTSLGAPFLISVASVKNQYMTISISCAADDEQKTKCRKIRDGMLDVLDKL